MSIIASIRSGSGVAALLLSVSMLHALKRTARSPTMSWLISTVSSLWRGSRLCIEGGRARSGSVGDRLHLLEQLHAHSLAIRAGNRWRRRDLPSY